MRRFLCHRKLLLLVVLGICWPGPVRLRAQTEQIQSAVTGLLQRQRENHLQWVWRWMGILGTEIDTTEFEGTLSLFEASVRLAVQLGRNGIDFDLFLDDPNLVEGGAVDDLWKHPINLSGLPTRVSLNQFLLEMLD